MRFPALLAVVLLLPAAAEARPKKKAKAAKAGAGGVWACGVRMLPLLEGNQWTYNSVPAPLPPLDLDADDEAFAVQLAALTTSAEVAKRIGVTTAMLRVPPATDRLPFHEYFSVIQTRIDQIAAVFAAEDTQVGLYFTAIPSNAEGKQFKFVVDVTGFLALFRSCTSKNVGIIFDSRSWHIGGGAADQLAELPVDRVYGIRIADLVEDVSLKEVTSKERLLPGSNGTVDNVRYIRHFAEAGYKGPVTAMGYPLNTGSTRDSSVSLAQDALDKVLEEAGVPSTKRKPEMFAQASYSSYQSEDRGYRDRDRD